MQSRVKDTVTRKGWIIFAGAFIVVAVVAVGTGFHVWTAKNIPYSYRQTPLDIVDYIAGKNVFNRADSLQ